jgi:hypothetical protein
MRHTQSSIGPTVGEGARVSYFGDYYMLYAGVHTGNQQFWSTNSGQAENAVEDPDRTISGFPMVLDYEWQVSNKYFSHFPDTIDRFFSPADAVDFPGTTQLAPLSDVLLDRMWAYCLMLGRQAPIYWGGENQDFWMSERQQIKSGRFIAPIVAHMKADPKADVVITYYFGEGPRTFEQAYSEVGLDGLRRCKVRIEKEGRALFINRSSESWTIENFGGVDISIPSDGYAYLGVHGGKNITAGSVVIPALTGEERIDVCIIQGEQVAVDARDFEGDLFGVSTSEFPLQVLDTLRDIKISKDGSISVEDKGVVFPS